MAHTSQCYDMDFQQLHSDQSSLAWEGPMVLQEKKGLWHLRFFSPYLLANLVEADWSQYWHGQYFQSFTLRNTAFYLETVIKNTLYGF